MIKLCRIFATLICIPAAAFAQQKTIEPVRVHIKVLEEDTRKITPVMACITNVKSETVHMPPDGSLAGEPTEIELFFKGVEFTNDKTWVGPVRMTNGKGNNENRSILYELKPSIPHWKQPVMYQISGDFYIDLPPGKWRISLEHGNEYIPLHEEFHVADKAGEMKKTFVLKRWINLPGMGWYSGDVHVHHPTNKPSYRDYLLEYAKAEDVHVVNMLEMGHHLGTDFKQEGFGEKFRTCKGNYCLVSGQEDPRGRFGHIIGLNIEEKVRDITLYDYYDLVLKKLHQQPGAMVGYAHFAGWGNGIDKGFPWYVTTGEIDFVELMQFLKVNTLAYYDYLNLGFRITAAAGSDFPWASTIGDVRTFVFTGKKFSVDDWFAGLKAGHSYVTNGPALFLWADGKLPGTEIRRSKGNEVPVTVKAVSHPGIGTIRRISVYNNDGLVTEKINTGNQQTVELKFNHKLSSSQWLAAMVECENGAVAHTTPIYFLVDGKPTYSLTKGPAIINTQLDQIKAIRAEELAAKTVDKGVLERLDKATDFYIRLLEEMKAADRK